MTKPQDPIEPVTATMPPLAHARGTACANCGSVLQGSYCHVCGQHAHNPLKSFKHAVEDVFESFWHLDGRVFRTLRDICVPGRAVNAYLGGKRVGYIPPLRLYVILSLLTFFVAHFVTAGISGGGVDLKGGADFDRYKTTAEVVAERDRQLAQIDKAAAEVKQDPSDVGSQLASGGLVMARARIRTDADQRIAELEGRAVASKPDDMHVSVFGDTKFGAEGSFMRRLQEQWSRNANENARLFAKDGRAFVERVITHVPSLLLVLVPLFALVLRLLYPLRPMGYLEHLVVSLYSHSFLLLAVLAWMLAVLLERAIGGSLLSVTTGIVFWVGAPLYLLFSQKRIYGDGWPLTLLRWLIAGFAYFFLATFAFAVAMAMSLLGKA